MLVAADRVRLLLDCRTVCRKERKLALSWELIMLQPIPCLPGYSQLVADE